MAWCRPEDHGSQRPPKGSWPRPSQGLEVSEQCTGHGSLESCPGQSLIRQTVWRKRQCLLAKVKLQAAEELHFCTLHSSQSNWITWNFIEKQLVADKQLLLIAEKQLLLKSNGQLVWYCYFYWLLKSSYCWKAMVNALILLFSLIVKKQLCLKLWKAAIAEKQWSDIVTFTDCWKATMLKSSYFRKAEATKAKTSTSH